MEKFIPSAEEQAQAIKIAHKNKTGIIHINNKGEYFLDKQLCSTSVKGDANKFYSMTVSADGETAKVVYKKQLTAADLKANPLLRSAGYKVGDEIEVPNGEEPQTPAGDNGQKQDPPPGNPADTAPLIEPANFSIPKLKAELEKISDIEALNRIGRAEEGGQNRSGAMDAIRDRIKELEPKA